MTSNQAAPRALRLREQQPGCMARNQAAREAARLHEKQPGSTAWSESARKLAMQSPLEGTSTRPTLSETTQYRPTHTSHERERMTFTSALRMACVALLANAIAATAAAAEQHNFILLMPEAMQAANVNEAETPALARLREEGVFYSRSFSWFPDFTLASREKSAAGRAAGLVAFNHDRYATLMLDEYAPMTRR